MKLTEVAHALVAEGKGILVADESTSTIQKRFDSIGVASTEESRRAYRELLFTTADAEHFISGAILSDETARQKTSDGTPFVDLLASKGILPGIKVDKGAKPLAGAPGEKVTEGLDGLRERLEEYRDMGCRVANWRVEVTIDKANGLPGDYCLAANAHDVARYAKLCIEQDLVPMIESEVLMKGSHTVEECFTVTDRMLAHVFNELDVQDAFFEQVVLETNMILGGLACPQQTGIADVAGVTLQCLERRVPKDLPGIFFLSGDQSPSRAAAHLNAINAGRYKMPWRLSFSLGLALQVPVMEKWQGRDENFEIAQNIFFSLANV